jgi:hypothetical protein
MKATSVFTLTRTGACLIAFGAAATVGAAPITGWAVHNGTSTVGGTPAAPTFAPADNLTLMAPFNDIQLANDGDFVEVTTTLEMNDRTANTGTNALNTQLRVGIFDGPAGAVGFEDTPNLGYIIEYSNLAAGGLIREQTNAGQISPFTSPTNIGNGSAPTGNITGANPDPVTFTLILTRTLGALDLTGSIVSSAYSGSFSDTGNLGAYTFNRIGLFLGPNVDATDIVLTSSSVRTNVPEPATYALAALAVLGGFALKRRECFTA